MEHKVSAVTYDPSDSVQAIDVTITRTQDLIVKNMTKWAGFIVREEMSPGSSYWWPNEVGQDNRRIRGTLGITTWIATG